MAELILTINPGSTSTKLALFDGDKRIAEKQIRHDTDKLRTFDLVIDQFAYRMEAIDTWIDSLQFDRQEMKLVVGRGAPLRPLEGGSYEITALMLEDLRTSRYSNHASNLGAIIARHLGERYGVPSMISDPVTVDNFTAIARVSGVPEIERKCRVHALNIKEVCRREAIKRGRKLDELNFVAVHMGGGVSVAAIEKGRFIDANDALLGMGPFTPERTGALPVGDLARLCYSGKYTEKEMLNKLVHKSGLIAYLGSSDLREIEKMIDRGDDKALLYFNAMAYQIAKEIGAAATVLKGDFETIILTGGMANSQRLADEITTRVSFIKEVTVVAGEFEMEALAAAGRRFISGEESLKPY